MAKTIFEKRYIRCAQAIEAAVKAFGPDWAQRYEVVMETGVIPARWIVTPLAVAEEDSPAIIELPDGYNGATLPFYARPVKVDGGLVQLQCAAEGKGHLHRWARASELPGAKPAVTGLRLAEHIGTGSQLWAVSATGEDWDGCANWLVRADSLDGATATVKLQYGNIPEEDRPDAWEVVFVGDFA